ncbi:MAG: hypothetical protein HDS07_05735 [Bacteroides sp.]|nr:hypothetical protein [Bacteroides sp.]
MQTRSSQLPSPNTDKKHLDTASPAPKPSTLAIIRQFARLYDFNPSRHPSLSSYIPN